MSSPHLSSTATSTPIRFVASFAALLCALPAAAQTTTHVSVSAAGGAADGHSFPPALSADGRWIAFGSRATNLVPGDTNGVHDVFVRDRVSGAIERVSVSASGAQADSDSFAPVLTPDGRFVAFQSEASNLVPGDTNGFQDIFVRDRLNGTIERVNVDSAGVQATDHSESVSLSADGRFVAFASNADNLAGVIDFNWSTDVFVRDRLNGTTQRISVDSLGAQANGNSEDPQISADGSFVAFSSWASNLVALDTNGTEDVFVHELATGATVRVSLGLLAQSGDGPSRTPSLSADARFVAFASRASNLVPGDTNGWDVFVFDRQTFTTERVSVDSHELQANFDSTQPALSPDGRCVAFESDAQNLVTGDTNRRPDVFVRDRLYGTTERVSTATLGAEGDAGSFGAALSAEGRFVAFASFATNLAPSDTNALQDVFLRDREPALFPFCFGDGIDTSHTAVCPCGNFGAQGNGCAHSANAGGANLRASGTTAADDLVLVSSAAPATAFTMFLQHSAAGDTVFHDGVLCAGGTLVRLRGRAAAAGAASFPSSAFAIDATITLSQRGGVFPGQGVRRYYSAWFRNAASTFCPPATANVTNGLRVDW